MPLEVGSREVMFGVSVGGGAVGLVVSAVEDEMGAEPAAASGRVSV